MGTVHAFRKPEVTAQRGLKHMEYGLIGSSVLSSGLTNGDKIVCAYVGGKTHFSEDGWVRFGKREISNATGMTARNCLNSLNRAVKAEVLERKTCGDKNFYKPAPRENLYELKVSAPIMRAAEILPGEKLLLAYIRSKNSAKRPVRRRWALKDLNICERSLVKYFVRLRGIGLIKGYFDLSGTGHFTINLGEIFAGVRGKFLQGSGGNFCRGQGEIFAPPTEKVSEKVSGKLPEKQPMSPPRGDLEDGRFSCTSYPKEVNHEGEADVIDFKGAKLTPPKEPLGEDTSPIAKEFEEEYEKIDDTVKSKPAPSTPPGNKVARKPSGQEFKDRPSERWEFNNWRDKEPCHWHARDVVGYWLDRYRHHLGEEDPDFRCTDVKSLSFIIKHVKDYTQRWMDGKFARSKEIVDKVFEQDASRPRKLMYYFTPTRPGAGAALIERKVRGRMSGHEFNHIGANSSKHDERHKEFVRKLKEGKIK